MACEALEQVPEGEMEHDGRVYSLHASATHEECSVRSKVQLQLGQGTGTILFDLNRKHFNNAAHHSWAIRIAKRNIISL